MKKMNNLFIYLFIYLFIFNRYYRVNDVKRFTNSRPLRPGSEDFAVRNKGEAGMVQW